MARTIDSNGEPTRTAAQLTTDCGVNDAKGLVVAPEPWHSTDAIEGRQTLRHAPAAIADGLESALGVSQRRGRIALPIACKCGHCIKVGRKQIRARLSILGNPIFPDFFCTLQQFGDSLDVPANHPEVKVRNQEWKSVAFRAGREELEPALEEPPREILVDNPVEVATQQIGRRVHLAGLDPKLDRLLHQTLPGKPLRGPCGDAGALFRRFELRQPLQQQLPEQVVVAEPAALGVERNQEELVPLEPGEQLSCVILRRVLREEVRAQRSAESLERCGDRNSCRTSGGCNARTSDIR